jgi:hypothetical protein
MILFSGNGININRGKMNAIKAISDSLDSCGRGFKATPDDNHIIAIGYAIIGNF